MKRTDKKGFTIVELVIVIAVIAILAAVLIPNLSKMVRNAKESSDIQLIRNMNTAMQVESVGGTKRYDTAHDAITAATAAGYDLTKISLSDKENTILWDEENQCFAYLRRGETTPEYVPNSKKDNTNTPAEKLWKVETEVKEDGGYPYSVYWNGGDVATINVKNVGFDAGIANIGTVNYTGNAGKTVVIRTNGGTLNITAPNDTVHHYDFVMTLSVESVSATHCYYEHGFVGVLAKFNSGKFVTANTARFNQKKDAIVEKLGEKGDFSAGGSYEQHIFNKDGVSIFDNKVTNNDHKHNFAEEVVESTCTIAGNKHITCTLCGYEKIEPLDLAPHTWVDVAKEEPTCTKKGHEAGQKCSVCEAVEGCDEIDMIPHTEKTVMTAETVDTDGKIDTVCSVCNVVIQTVTIKSDNALTNSVARIVHGEGYTTLQDAINATVEGDIVKILKDITLTDALTIGEDKKISLDLNGKTISGKQGGSRNDSLFTEYLILNNGTINSLKNGNIVCETQGTSFTNGPGRFAALQNNAIIGEIDDLKVDISDSYGIALKNSGTISSINNSLFYSHDESYPFYN